MAFFSFMQVYTDTFDTYRTVKTGTNPPNLVETGATVNMSNMLCCELGNDIQGGDEIIVHRGANVGRFVNPDERYIAGPPNIYVEPFGGASPDLEHIQVSLTDEHLIH